MNGILNLSILRNEEEINVRPKSKLISNLESLLENFEQFGVTDSVKALIMTDPLMAERIEGQTDEQIVETVKALHVLAITTEAANEKTDTLTDQVFGKLTRKGKYNSWHKYEKHTILGQTVNVQILVKAEVISDKQRNSYEYFKKNVKGLDNAMRKELEVYAKATDAALSDDDYKYDPKHLDQLEIKTVLFDDDFESSDPKIEAMGFAVLGECAWDEEHGFGVGVFIDGKGKVKIVAAQHSAWF